MTLAKHIREFHESMDDKNLKRIVEKLIAHKKGSLPSTYGHAIYEYSYWRQ